VGRSPGMGGAILAWGTECPIERAIGSPLDKILCFVTLRTDMFYGPGLRKPYMPTRFIWVRDGCTTC
jgi:hypothetical protein